MNNQIATNKYDFRILLPITIFWNCYLPEKKSEWIKIEDFYKEEKYEIRFGMKKESDHIDVIGQKNIPNQYFPTKSIWLYIRCFWSVEFDELQKYIKKESSSYHEKIKFLTKKYYQRLVEVIRTQFDQYWIDPSIVNDKNLWNDLQIQLPSKEWIAFFPQQHFFKSRIYKDGISKVKWKELKKILQDSSKVDMISQMITNAMYYNMFDNGRMAVVEACTALEAFIKQNIPPALSKINKNIFDEKDIEKSIKKLGFSYTTNLFFKYLSDSFNLDEQLKKKCLELIDIRNNVIHNKARYVKPSDAEGLINAVKNLIKKLL